MHIPIIILFFKVQYGLSPRFVIVYFQKDVQNQPLLIPLVDSWTNGTVLRFCFSFKPFFLTMQSGGALNFGSWRENPQYFLHLKKSVRFLFLEKKNLICSALSAWYFTKTHRQQKANHMRLQVFLSLPRFLSHCQVSTYLSAENPSGCMRFQPKTCYTFHPTGHRSILLLFSLFP